MSTAHPVAFYLRDLSGEPVRRSGRGAFPGAESVSEAEAQIADAHARGVIEGRAAAEAAYQEVAKRQAAAFEERLATEREAWSRDQGAHLATLIKSGLDDVERRISDRVGHILQPILGDEIRARAITELSRTLDRLLAKGEYGKITVSGPQDLLSALQAGLASDQSAITFVVAEGPDVAISADETILETQIGAWGRALQGVSP